MSIALDYTSRIDPKALQAAGVTVVCRYLSWLYRWGGQVHSTVNPKIVQQREYAELRAAGIEIVLNWEYDPRDWMTGKPGGTQQAIEAVRQTQLLGHPPGGVIAGSADFDMTRAQWDAAAGAYAAAFEASIRAGGYLPGVYGPADVLTWCRDETGIDWFWQAGMSTAWSGGRNRNAWPGAHLRQRGAKTVGGVSGDWNDILRTWEADVSGEFADQALKELDGRNALGDAYLRLANGNGVNSDSIAAVRADLKALGEKVDALGTGGVDLDALAAKVAAQLAPLVPTAAQVAAQIIGQLGAK